ncbi:MAG: Maf family protein [Desulfobacterales bacterium]
MQKRSPDPLLILASKSPRRRYLLNQAGLSFAVIPSHFDESSVSLSSPSTYVKALAEGKAEDISHRHPQSWVIGADTVVLIDGLILGKPGSRSQARTMLKRLSGKIHKVLTGYAIYCDAKQKKYSDVVTTEVAFKKLTAKEIEWYVHTAEPFDKAGAYAVQGLGSFLVKRINGSYTNVVGLPVCEVLELLIKERVFDLDTETENLRSSGRAKTIRQCA